MVSYGNNVKAGTATATVTGKGNYTGSTAASFKIVPASIAKASVTLASASYTYDGSAKKPGVAVRLGDKTLKAGTDYTVSYGNNVKAGAATATVTGKGNYTGSKKVNFKIAPASIAKANVGSIANQPYTGKAVTPKPTVKLGGKTLKLGSDYTLSYANNTKAGTATVTVKGKGNYTGTRKKTFKIVAPSVNYRVHRQTYGWETSWKKNGATSGTMGESKRLEAIEIQLGSKPVTGSIQYRTHVQTYGWQNWKNEGALSGTLGESKRLEAIEIRLTGAMAKKYDVYYRVHAQTFGWLGWARNGASAGTAGYSKRLEAIEIVLVPKGAKAPGTTAGAFLAR